MRRFFETLLTAVIIATSAFAFFIAASVLFASCDDDGENEKLNPEYKIYINGRDDAGNKAAALGKMTVHEICTHDSIGLLASTGSFFCFSYTPSVIGTNGFFPLDTVNDRLVMQAGNITTVEDNPFLSPEVKWIITTINEGAYDVVDTIGYLPTTSRTAVIDTLTTLFADGREKNIDAILDIFQTAFIFVPCTAEEYRELESKGLN